MVFEAIMKNASSCNHFIKGSHPKASIKISAIKKFLDQGWVWQKKINGRRLVLVLYPDGIYEAWTRHGTRFTTKLSTELIAMIFKLYQPKNNYTVIEGEWLKGKVYLFDILAIEGESLSNLTYVERHRLLKKSFISPILELLVFSNSLPLALKVMQDSCKETEGIVLKSPFAGFSDDQIVRCKKISNQFMRVY